MPGRHKYQREKFKLNLIQSKISRDILNRIWKNYDYKYFKTNSLKLVNFINQQLLLQNELPIYTLFKLNAWVSNKKYKNNCIWKQKILKQKILKQKILKQKILKQKIFDNFDFDVDFKLINEILESKELQNELPFLKIIID